mmetsp:Transcript_48980/g.59079  ORF Transcript_48980/g.59079 Transcript_48980/m.59079 type:complete len:170 (-) Transcript_48980:449-958(-)
MIELKPSEFVHISKITFDLFPISKLIHHINTIFNPGYRTNHYTPHGNHPKHTHNNRNIISPLLGQKQVVRDIKCHREPNNDSTRKINHRIAKLHIPVTVEDPVSGATVSKIDGTFHANKHILERIREFSDQHHRHAEHVTGADDAAPDHAEACHHMVREEAPSRGRQSH